MIEISILKPCRVSKWVFSTFIILKKDWWVWKISKLHSLNKAIICKQYPLPIIKGMFDHIFGYNFLTKLDISMQYHTWAQWAQSRTLHHCYTFWQVQIQTPPHGSQIHSWLCPTSHRGGMTWNCDDTGIYAANISIFSFPWEHHSCLLNRILHWLEANDFIIHSLKFKWAIQETD